jgi:predicted SAM-dependent methyltransferase
MKFDKQVDKNHYIFQNYIPKARWCSIWHQIDEIQKLQPKSVLEIGPGPSILKMILGYMQLPIETIDVDPELKPTYVGSATSLPFNDATYDLVCAFQVLEHLPYDDALHAFAEMVRVSKKNILISLPDARMTLQYKFYLPRLGSYAFLVPHPRYKAQEHQFDCEHYWEINKIGYDLKKVSLNLSRYAKLVKTYQVFENPYHRFFIFEKINP